MRRTARAVAIAALTALVLAGCAPTHATPPVHKPPASAASPTRTPTPTPTPDAAADLVGRMSLAEQAANVVMGHLPTTDPAALRAFMASGPDGAHLGGFILMGANISGDVSQVRALADSLALDPALPPLIAVDQEGGVVSRLPWDELPGGRVLQNSDATQTQAVFGQRARLVADAGANVNFGVIADVPADAHSFIAARALGTDPAAAADRVAAAVRGESGVVLSTLKHFPGHGAAPGDSHHGIPSAAEPYDQWRATDAKPFEAGIAAGAELLMFGHLAYTAVDSAPASLSERWHEVARDELGFRGVMITDDLGMLTSSGVPAYRDPVADAVAAIAAGNDMVLMVQGSTAQTASALAAGIARAVQDGRLPAERLRDAAEHVLTLRLALRQAQ